MVSKPHVEPTLFQYLGQRSRSTSKTTLAQCSCLATWLRERANEYYLQNSITNDLWNSEKHLPGLLDKGWIEQGKSVRIIGSIGFRWIGRIHIDPAKLIYLNFQPLEVLFCCGWKLHIFD